MSEHESTPAGECLTVLTCPQCDQPSLYALEASQQETLPSELPCLARNNVCTYVFDAETIADAYAHPLHYS